MDERRATIRERVIYGATASVPSGPARDCVVRNFSTAGALVVFKNAMRLPDDIALTIARKGRAYQARVVWWRDNAVGLAFAEDAPSIAPQDLDLEEQLRVSQKQTRKLKRRVRELLDGG